jgi:hypothetical protein
MLVDFKQSRQILALFINPVFSESESFVINANADDIVISPFCNCRT